ncbi:MAG TPA: hypothetical protein VLH75_06095 [Longimicrobiales bacterium]|nr:hypothetical protein [Longimicrobiales bacterium]
MTDFQIRRLLQERRLEAYVATDGEVVGFLEKAVRAMADAKAGISEEGAFLRAYEATFLCATAAVLSAGYRMRGSAEGHHNDLVLVLRHLGDSAFADLGTRWERLRRLRSQSMYDGAARPTPEDVDAMIAVATDLFAAVRRDLESKRPSAGAMLPALPPGEGRRSR